MVSVPIFSIALGVLASLLQISGYFDYFKKIGLGRIKPNAASWSIWAFGAVLESSSYVFVTGDWVKNLLPIACALCAVALFLICLKRGHFEPITRFEWALIVADCIAIFVWWWFESATYANFLLILTAIISFVPIIFHAWKDPTVEHAQPWFLWTIAYAVLGVVVSLRWEKWEDLVYPGIFFILHLIVAILALDSRGQKKVQSKKQ